MNGDKPVNKKNKIEKRTVYFRFLNLFRNPKIPGESRVVLGGRSSENDMLIKENIKTI